MDLETSRICAKNGNSTPTRIETTVVDAFQRISEQMKMRSKTLGMVGGLGPLASADIFFKLTEATPAESDKDHFNVIIEQHPFDDGKAGADEDFNPTSRKIYIFNTIKDLEKRNIDAVLLTCFISHTFIEDLKSSINVPIVNQLEALHSMVQKTHPDVHKLGILTSNYVRKSGEFERYFDPSRYELIYPSETVQNDCLMEAIYGKQGIKAGQLRGASISLLLEACNELAEKGAELIIPGLTEIPIVIDRLRAHSQVPIIDSNRVYAEYAVQYQGSAAEKDFSIGIVGGVGPSATVDFLEKIIRHTPADKDQDHVRMIVDHDPKIPDRTANLLGDGSDPTIPLYAACKRLEINGVDMIAIPCNTAHVFVERIQRYLSVPIINMLFESVQHIKHHHGSVKTIGLLATEGTVKSRIYHDLVEQSGRRIVVPDDKYQRMLMNVIYGDKGVKAGYTDGICLTEFRQVLAHIISAGAELVILGCTELPLVSASINAGSEQRVRMLDPSDILARKCAEFSARGEN